MSRLPKNMMNEFEKRMLAYGQLNRFLIAFIDNVNIDFIENYTSPTHSYFKIMNFI